MKIIPKISLEGAKVLTPPEMNKIHLETGLHSPAKSSQNAKPRD